MIFQKYFLKSFSLIPFENFPLYNNIRSYGIRMYCCMCEMDTRIIVDDVHPFDKVVK